jgi:hypothetical protein
MIDRVMKMDRRTKWAGLQATGNGPDILRLQIMDREIITKILVVRPVGEANALQSADDPLAPSPDGDAGGRRPADDR